MNKKHWYYRKLDKLEADKLKKIKNETKKEK
jgi:hypothetical protein